MDHFERCLENCPPDERILIVRRRLQHGSDIADLRGTLKLASLWRRVYVDEATASESSGHRRRRRRAPGRLDKSTSSWAPSAIAGVGSGFIAGERSVIDYLKHTSAVRLFRSLPAASVRPWPRLSRS